MPDTRIASQILTEADTIRLSKNGQRYELVNGELVMMSPNGFLHVIVSNNVYDVLKASSKIHKNGYVCGDNLIYVLHVDPETGKRTTRIPDTSFIRKGRLPKKFNLSRPFPGAPNLAIEVMSPEDTAEELLERVRDYLTYGTEQVWVFYPRPKEVHQYKRGESLVRIYTEKDVLDASDFFPGLLLDIAPLIELPQLDDEDEVAE